MNDRFPLLGGKETIPWTDIAPHESQAWKNHHQTLVKLASRGGLSEGEAVAVLEDRDWHLMKIEDAHKRLRELTTVMGSGNGQ